MVSPIRPTGVSSISAIGRGTDSRASSTGGTLRSLTRRVAGRMAREFCLLDDERDFAEPEDYREGDDIYKIGEAARELTADLHGGPADEGRLARSLDGFVQESASLIAARPDAASLDTIARAIVANERRDGPETIDVSLRQIDQTARDIARSDIVGSSAR